MSALITVDLRDATPPYEQIRAQVASLIAIGTLTDGERLPTVRALAADLGVATGTVSRAYKELESSGLIASRRRLGTVVTRPAEGSGPGGAGAAENLDLHRALDLLVAEADQAGIDDQTLLDLLRGRLRTRR
ncbi:GntR family transcriptional regulator [Paeniglutamicibacter cryotolerans]|uniref:DNA-binding transcriptional regulator YhcF (GntR family) n=1 Tax=Paeniglutamicibacter cryotolerans TaxID=670079 RepID=A0A839QD00_9MICC|nr:GntR family transcriptional regulator [Paeniglutamicibacter cryotolerans]MBB2994018.1 DNA-binding transcriptional regulator YhcF (GntR family) [Paeniglutamicibacter cryotolerans]